ncbi:Hsp20/alpha crystallin family protein [Mastigocoleus testarum]|uniref:Heat-shock protein n=1 Tax=Mastigocoleus testarum BC008 TaxID=371196 RepID=A0A0V7ZNP3_9CYAN|nr:Hsp20/alpha crystallin family protein [Mastigocoleus testarum]KST66172.1 heat-shock protein [Mastigocoleus testarum BC008]
MTIVRYSPWKTRGLASQRAEITSLQRQLDRMFEDVKAPVFRTPAAELTETDDALHLKLELPGMEAKDIDVEVTEKAVKVLAERKSETQTEGKGNTRSEFYYGKYQRVIPLKARIQNTNVTAEYKDGILNLKLPKTVEEKNKVVRINLEQN